jgi:hypothetical protein
VLDKWPILSTRSIEATTLLRTGNSPLSALERASDFLCANVMRLEKVNYPTARFYSPALDWVVCGEAEDGWAMPEHHGLEAG